MKNIFMLLFVGACVVDTGIPYHTQPYLLDPVCDNVQDMYFEMGNPDYCYPDQCCTWAYYNYSGWYCEETWCEYWDSYGCWWEVTEVECF